LISFFGLSDSRNRGRKSSVFENAFLPFSRTAPVKFDSERIIFRFFQPTKACLQRSQAIQSNCGRNFTYRPAFGLRGRVDAPVLATFQEARASGFNSGSSPSSGSGFCPKRTDSWVVYYMGKENPAILVTGATGLNGFAVIREFAKSRVNLATHEAFGIQPTTFKEFARRNAAAFRGGSSRV
jgi:hypothetical protein